MNAGQGISGNLYDANYFNASNQVWSGSAFVAWVDANYASYRTPMPETGTSGRFPLPTPPAGTTSWEMRLRGATLADSYVVWEGQTTDSIVTAIKADAALGTESGGMVANAEAIKAKTDMIGTLGSETRW